MSTEDKMAKQRSLLDILVDFMGYTTGHGFARLVAATSTAWRIFWIIAVLGAFGMFVYHASNLFQLFLSRPIKTSVTVAFEKVGFFYYGHETLQILKKRSFWR